MDLHVKVQFPEGIIERGILTYSANGPSIKLLNGKRLDSNSLDDGVSFSFLDKSLAGTNSLPVGNHFEVLLKSRMAIRKYSPDLSSQFEMYPPSSNSWFTHISESGEDALFIVQAIKNNPKLLLTIISLSTYGLLAVYLVNRYEVEVLFREPRPILN